MKLLSLWEPWATLMAIGAKKIETRSWDTNYRGQLAIHASKGGLGKRELAAVLDEPVFQSALAGERLSPGCIVAVVRLETCWPTHLIARAFGADRLTEQERTFGDYTDGRYGWVTSGLFRLPEPIPFKGKQGLIDVPPDVLVEIWRQRGAYGR